VTEPTTTRVGGFLEERKGRKPLLKKKLMGKRDMAVGLPAWAFADVGDMIMYHTKCVLCVK